ncbi:MAG: hypothetical protein OXF51_04715 [Alphaproteobacteria bacterium]|nr:hypothetical protein [Alphaproteobacteria bacterium]
MEIHKTNRPHFHVWAESRNGRMLYKVRRAFHTPQAARKWGNRHYRDRLGKDFMIRACERPECAPKLD